jgi:hypothetical protein
MYIKVNLIEQSHGQKEYQEKLIGSVRKVTDPMQKALVFFVAIIILALFVMTRPVEGFTDLMGVNWNDMNKGTPSALYTKLPIQQPNVVSLAEAGVGNIQPSPPPPGGLPSAPAPQRSKETPNPYKNPTMEPAKYIQILGIKADLQAFFGFQAFMLEDRNDPAIQIPLTRARADMVELINVASVMERNPGLPSRITMKQLDDIRSNLSYLRDILHELESSGAIEPRALEGFENMNLEGEVAMAEVVVEGFQETTASTTNTGSRATLQQLQDFQVKVVAEITRLQAYGTTDPVIQGRVNTLNRIKDEVDDVIAKISSGFYTKDTIPIFYKDIESALPLLGKTSDPLPTILQQTGLPAGIQNLFPGGLSPKDTEQAQQINNIVKGYMKNLTEGTSWGVDVSVKYDNPKILKLRAAAAEAESKVGISTGLPGVPGASGQQVQQQQVQGATREVMFSNISQTDKTSVSGYDSGLPGVTISRTLQEPMVGSLDWKERSTQIREQIRRRGLNPADFGAMPEDIEVSPEFSWRGYTQMICSRLNSTTDPGLAHTVGCPPQGWEGWRS